MIRDLAVLGSPVGWTTGGKGTGITQPERLNEKTPCDGEAIV